MDNWAVAMLGEGSVGKSALVQQVCTLTKLYGYWGCLQYPFHLACYGIVRRYAWLDP
jgi:hypothetical protein